MCFIAFNINVTLEANYLTQYPPINHHERGFVLSHIYLKHVRLVLNTRHACQSATKFKSRAVDSVLYYNPDQTEYRGRQWRVHIFELTIHH